MKRFDNYPKCTKCGQSFDDYENRFTYRQVSQSGYMFDYICPTCDTKLWISPVTKRVWDVEAEGEGQIKPLVDKEMSVWVSLGQRSDGSLYVGVPFESKDALVHFYETHPEFEKIGMAEFKGTFKVEKKHEEK